MSLAWAWASRSAATYAALRDKDKLLRMKHLMGAVLVEESRHDDAYAHQAQMQELIEGTCDRRQLAWCFMEMGHARLQTSRHLHAIEDYDRAAREAKSVGDGRIQALALLGSALGLMSRRELGKAAERLKTARSLVSRDSAGDWELQSALDWHESWLAFLKTNQDSAASRFATQVLRLDGTRTYQVCRASSLATLGIIALTQSAAREARDHFEAAVTVITASGNKYCLHLFQTYRAVATVLGGCERQARAESLQYLADAIDFGRATDSPELRFKAAAALASFCGQRAAASEALEALASASSLSAESLLRRRDLAYFAELSAL